MMAVYKSEYKIVEYSIITEVLIDDMIQHVNKLIDEGWEPIGGAWGECLIHQTMVRREFIEEIPADGWTYKAGTVVRGDSELKIKYEE